LIIRIGRALSLGCLLLLAPLASAAGNPLLVPAAGRCMLDLPAEQVHEALLDCQQLAQSGDAQAQFELGEFHYRDTPLPRDLRQAQYWFEQASLQGHAQAQFYLGMMFFNGEGVPANKVQAFIVLKMAAINGSEEALDAADRVAEQMSQSEVEISTQVLGQIFRNYLLELQGLGEEPESPNQQDPLQQQ
jgi:TPR repeat protein